MKRTLDLIEGLHLFMLCKQSIKALEDVKKRYREDNKKEDDSAKIVDTFKMFEALLKDARNEDENENILSNLFKEVYYKDMNNVLKGMMNNPNVVYILDNTPYNKEDGYSQNLFITVADQVIKHINQLANDLQDNLYLRVPYDLLNDEVYSNRKLDQIRMSDSYPERYGKDDKNFEILPDIFKAKLNSLNKNNILEILRMIAGGNTIQDVGEIFNCDFDIKLIVIDLIEKMAGAIATYKLYNRLVKPRTAKIISDSTNDLLTNIQKEAAGILIHIENSVTDHLVLEDISLDTFDNALIDTAGVYSIVLKTKIWNKPGDKESGEEYQPYKYGLVINNYAGTAEGDSIICKENVDLLTEESLLVVMGNMILSLFNTIENSMKYDIIEASSRDLLDESRNTMDKVINKILQEFPTPEDYNRILEILKVNFKNRHNLDDKLGRLTLYRNTVSNDDIPMLAKAINIFVESLNN